MEAAQSAPKMAFSAFSFSAMPAEPSASAESTALRDTSARNPTGGSGATARLPTPPPEPKTTSQQLATPASSFNSSSIPAALTPLPAFNPQNGPLPTLPSPPPENEVSYYTFLRGLNTSFVSFLSQSIDSDPFLDLTQCLPGLLHQYELHLEEAAAKAGKGPQGTKPAPIAQASISRPPDNTVKPPAPSSVGSFTLLKASTPSALPSSGGFVPTLPAAGSSSSPFSFGAFGATKLAETAAPPKVAVAPAAKKPSAEVMELIDEVMAERPEEEKAPDAPRPFSFTTPTPTSTPEPKKSTPLFSFAPSGPLHKTTPESKTFYPSANVEAASPPPGLGKFGPGGSTPQLTFGGAKPSGSGTLATKPSFGASQTGFSFGSSSSSPVFSIGADSSGETSKSAAPSFSFGVKPANSAPNPTTFAFSFGTNPSTSAPKSTAPAFSFGSTTPPFAFGTPSSAGPSEAPSADESADATPEPIEPSKNLAESVGAGEEGEDTVIEQRGKLYHLEEGKFGLVGLGQFKVKRAKKGESGKRKRRLLMRTDGGGNVVLVCGNALTWSSMS